MFVYQLHSISCLNTISIPFCAIYCTLSLNGLKNRGVEDIFIACTDNLARFDAAIHAAFSQTEIQNCILHPLRNSSRDVSYKDVKALMANLKAVYAAVDEQAWMPWTPLESARTGNIRESPSPGGQTGSI